MSNYNFDVNQTDIERLTSLRPTCAAGLRDTRASNGGTLRRIIAHAYLHRAAILPALPPAPLDDGRRRRLTIQLDTEERAALQALAGQMEERQNRMVARLIAHYFNLRREYLDYNEQPSGATLAFDDDRPQPFYSARLESEAHYRARMAAMLHDRAQHPSPAYTPQPREPEAERWHAARMAEWRAEEDGRRWQLVGLAVVALVAVAAIIGGVIIFWSLM